MHRTRLFLRICALFILSALALTSLCGCEIGEYEELSTRKNYKNSSSPVTRPTSNANNNSNQGNSNGNNSGAKRVALTFDDGPHPTITPQVLKILKQFNAKATFFCVGNNINHNKDVFKMILKEGHSVGNHTYNHEKGWKTKTKDYIASVNKTNELIQHSDMENLSLENIILR